MDTEKIRVEGFPLVSFVCQTDADLLPHFVRWYQRLGVDRFLFLLHGTWDEEVRRAVVSLPGVEAIAAPEGVFCKELKCDAITSVAQRFRGEWVVFADADEFLELPAPDLHAIVDALEAAGIEELYASLLQRVAADGSLPEVSAQSDLDALFPMFHAGLCEDMGLAVPAWKSKYPLARIGPDFYYQRGNHLPGNFRSVAHVPMRAVLHHFKWRSRLYEAFARQRGTGTNFGEMAVYREWLETHGRLPMEGAKRCSRAALEAEGWLRRPTQEEGRLLKALIQERSAGASSGLRVGFVSFELGGPGTPNGGIATAISALAKLQAAHGIAVDVFYCPFHMPRELPPLWFEYWSTFGVTLHYIPRQAPDEDRTLETHEVEQAIVEAVRRAGHFDLLHFHDTQGFAAAFTMLKAAGLAFTETTLAITTHGGTRWHNEPNGTPWDEAAYEQELVGQHLCDVVVSPSAYLIEWNRVHGALPGRELVLPNVLEPESKSFTLPVQEPVLPGCVAFFGRVEIRKGFDLFLAALRQLVNTTDLRPEVLILGRFGNGYSQERFDAETADLPLRVMHHKSLNPQQALRMLKDRRALAIMPSRQENSPYVVYEAMENQLPFLASFTGGTAELIRSEDRPIAELPADPIAMAATMAGALRDGLRPARLAIDPLEIELRNLTTWRSLAAERGHPAPGSEVPATIPPLARVPLSEWRLAARRDPRDIVALVPEGDAVSDSLLQGMTRLLVRASFASVVEPFCRVVEEDTGRQMTSLQIRKKATPRESALITGALPLVLRAGVLAELMPRIEAAAPERLFADLMEAIHASGKTVLPAPIEVGSHRFDPGLEQRALCTRLWLPIGRAARVERPPAAREDIWQLCGVLSSDPFVAISTWSGAAPYGALSLFPAAFQQRPSLHLISLGSSLLWAVPKELPRRLAEAAERWPLARFRVLASDAVELQALREAGLPALLGNLNMFVSEQEFHPGPGDETIPPLDAICVGALELRENHWLAQRVASLGLVHHRYAGMDDVGDAVRRLLPQALFLTDDPSREQGFFYPSKPQLAGWIRRAACGLVLSENGGTCPVSVQMLLCGTPVVSVTNVGGRDHFLHPPHALQVATDPEAVAEAVREFKARNLPREEVHRVMLGQLRVARTCFARDVEQAMLEDLGTRGGGVDVDALIGRADRYNRAVETFTRAVPWLEQTGHLTEHAVAPQPPSATMRISEKTIPIVAVVCESDADLLPHFVHWYQKLGVERFLLVMHGRWDEHTRAQILSIPGVDCVVTREGELSEQDKCDVITELAREFIGRWLVFADPDEFLEFPAADLQAMVEALEAAGIDELYANLLPRVAADGSLPDVGPHSDLDALFPLFHPGLCEDMGMRVPAGKSKYPLARIRPDFAYKRGNHLPGNSRSVAHVPMRAVMHHFRWRSRPYEALKGDQRSNMPSAEMAALQQWLETHGALPLVGAKPCSRALLELEGWLRRPAADEMPSLMALMQERENARASALRVGFVTFELGGPGTANGGIATAVSALAKLQAAHGIAVEVFYCPFEKPRDLSSLWFEYWASFGVKLHYISRQAVDEDRTLETHEVEQSIVEAVQREGHFDLLHIHDNLGFAAPFTMLKAAGTAFTNTTLAITAHGGTRWHNEPNGTAWDAASYAQEFVGQRLCDVLVSPSAYLIDWNRAQSALPGRELVLPNVLEPESKSFTRSVDTAVLPGCLAFFGRVEKRKGFDLFLAAIRDLVRSTDLRPDVLILGRFGNGYSQDRFEAEIADLPVRVTHHSTLNPQQALRLLKERKALVIMPSRLENSPYVVYEALENQLPFLVSFTGGTAELIRREDWPLAELPADPAAMATKMALALREGLRPARLAIDPLEIELRNLTTWRSLASERGQSSVADREQATPPINRVPLGEWRLATRLGSREIVSLVPEGFPVADEQLLAMTRLLVCAEFADVVQPFCRVVEEGSERQMTSLLLHTKATPQEASLITDALPLVLRAGVLADLQQQLSDVSDDQLYGTLMASIQIAGKRVLPAPIDVGMRRLKLGLEARSVCNRLWLPIGRPNRQESPREDPIDTYQLCGVLSTQPYVAISTWSEAAPYGALSLFPQAFQAKPSLHLITLGSSLLWAVSRELPRRLAEAAERWPLARFRVLAADPVELQGLRQAGLPALLGNLNMFVSEQDFHPPRHGLPRLTWDAICIGPFGLRENHFLARQIPSLALIHHRYEGMDDVEQEVRRLLPHADYLTDDTESSEGFFYPSTDQICSWIGQSATGVVLSETHGTCPETVQMLLCGTPIVSVRNIGGRDHFLDPAHAVHVEATPEAVAAGVAELKARNLSRQEVYRSTLRRLQDARVRFAADVDEAIAQEFGPGLPRVDVDGLIGVAARYRKAVDVLAEGLSTVSESAFSCGTSVVANPLLESPKESKPELRPLESTETRMPTPARFTPDVIRHKLQTAEQMISQGSSIEEVCGVLEVTAITFQRWRHQYGGMSHEEAQRLADLEMENAQLKKLLAEAELEKAKLRDLLRAPV